MRASAIIPIVLSLGALVLTLLCMFAGSKTSFMPSYAVITLNTSEFGSQALDNSNSAVSALINDLPSNVQTEIKDAINSVARSLGMHDFYNAHILNYCEGYYEPGPVPNATLKLSSIHQNYTNCSTPTALFQFDPKQVIQNELDNSGHSDINVTETLNWPHDVQVGLDALHAAQKAVFILYCVGIGLTAIAFVFSVISFCLTGRLSAFFNVIIAFLDFLVIGVASAIVTVIAVHGSKLINKYGKDVGLSASAGGKFLALTWAATAAMVICSLWWCLDCIIGHRSNRARYPKTY